MSFTRSLLAAALMLSLGGCAATVAPRAQSIPEDEGPVVVDSVAPVAVVPVVAAGPGANDNLNAVAWMQTSVEYRLIAGQTFRAALAQLDRAIKNPGWDALVPSERETAATGLPLAIIVDIDETMLDNSPYQARLIRDGKSFDDTTWDLWVQERAARPLPGALEFARAASARGVTIFYVSNRTAAQGPATLDNLRKAGFPAQDPGQFLGLGSQVPGCEGKASNKGCRRRLVGRTHRVLMQIGDQLGDLVDIGTNSPAGREQAVRANLGWVGERWFMLPNPSYGSWEPALFNNAWSRPEGERRAEKQGALRY